jgi:hypothetical protein
MGGEIKESVFGEDLGKGRASIKVSRVAHGEM